MCRACAYQHDSAFVRRKHLEGGWVFDPLSLLLQGLMRIYTCILQSTCTTCALLAVDLYCARATWPASMCSSTPLTAPPWQISILPHELAATGGQLRSACCVQYYCSTCSNVSPVSLQWPLFPGAALCFSQPESCVCAALQPCADTDHHATTLLICK